jgi:hypothetical protein
MRLRDMPNGAARRPAVKYSTQGQQTSPRTICPNTQIPAGAPIRTIQKPRKMSIDLSDIIYLLFRKFLIWNPWKSII